MRVDINELAEAVTEARKHLSLSVAKAAAKAGIDRVTWKRIEDGLPVHDVNRWKVEQFLGLDQPRTDLSVETAASAAPIIAEGLDPDLAEFTDQDLIDELAGRISLLASRLAAYGEDVMVTVINNDGARELQSHATKPVAVQRQDSERRRAGGSTKRAAPSQPR